MTLFAILAACGSNGDGRSAKGKMQSDHGALSFGAPHQVAFTDQLLFHSWTFTLTERAKVDLRTQNLAQEVDTVLHLRDATDKRGIETDDNGERMGQDEGSKASHLARSLPAGTYEVLVRGSDRLQRGGFELLGACEGPGCPVAVECDPNVSLGTATPLTEAVHDGVVDLLTAEVSDNGEGTLSMDNTCAQGQSVATAVAIYQAVWQADDPAVIEGLDSVNVSTEPRGEVGTVVWVSQQADDALAVLLGPNANPLGVVGADKVRWFGTEASLEVTVQPEAQCVAALVDALPAVGEFQSGSDAPDLVETAASALHSAAEVVRYRTWDDGASAEVEVEATDFTGAAVITKTQEETLMLLRDGGEGYDIACEVP